MRRKNDLETYRKKRDFKQTQEPGGSIQKKAGHSYLIQKHAASHLHYDFRLELNGVLKSWAVPKGPSYDPGDKRLAMEVEDHPVQYGRFEGIIPKGQYGGGTVMLWDTGTWKPVGDAEEGLRKGKLVFQLYGKRLKGEWTLVRTFSRDGSRNKWLLIKHKDEYVKTGANAAFLDKNASSIVSKRTMEAIAKAGDKVWESDRAEKAGNETKKRILVPAKKSRSPIHKKTKFPAFSVPQLATLADTMPKTDDWVHEIKFDGYRIVAHLNAGDVKLYSRNGNDWTDKFNSITKLLKAYDGSAILDGEVVVSDVPGGSNFSALKEALSVGDTTRLQYYVFDLLFLNGQDVSKLDLLERKALLEKLIIDNKTKANDNRIIYSEHFEDNTDHFLQNACSLHLEGVMSKRKDAPYISGRTKTWLKTKCHKRQEFVIGGFTLSSKGGTGIGSLLLGYYDKREFVYAGRVGTGFTSKSSRDLRKVLEKIKRKQMAYTSVSAEGRRGAIWVEPKLVGEVEFTEWTPDGHLRHPSFQGLREDKKAISIIKEVPEPTQKAVSEAETEVEKLPPRSKPSKNAKLKASKVFSATVTPIEPRSPKKLAGDKALIGGISISHPSRIIFPETKITKLQLAEYYYSVSGWIMPYIKDRPLSVLRCPEGMGKECFFQRHVGFGTNSDIHEVDIALKGKDHQYMAINNQRGLLSLIQWGVIELHPWQCTDKKLDNPDQMIFDLDPDPAVSWKELIAGAKFVRARLQQTGLDPYLKTTGGKGLHLVVPVKPIYDWQTLKSFARIVAETITNERPDQFIATMSKAARKGKIFIDYLRNDVTSTAVAPFSVRARTGATVSTPIAWDELKESFVSSKFTIETVPERLRKIKSDPWKGFSQDRQKISSKLLSQL